MQRGFASWELYVNLTAKDVIHLLSCQGHLKHFLEKYRFCRKSGNESNSWEWRVMLFASL